MIQTLKSRRFALILFPLLLVTAAATSARAAEKGKINLDHIPEEAFAAAVFQPQKLLSRPDFELMPVEIVEAAGKQALGFNPLEIETAIGFISFTGRGAPDEVGVVLHFTKPQKIGGELTARMKPVEYNGVKYLASDVNHEVGYCLFNEKTILIAPVATLESMIDNKFSNSPLRTLIASTGIASDATAFVAMEPIRPLLNQAVGMAPPLPGPMQSLLAIPDQVDSVRIDVNLDVRRASSITLTSKDAATAEEVERTLTDALAFLKQVLLQQAAAELRNGDNQVQQALLRYFTRLGDVVEKELEPVRKGNDVAIAVKVKPSYAAAPAMMAMLLPAIVKVRMAAHRMQFRDQPAAAVAVAAPRDQVRQQLRQIAIGMHNHHDVYSEFPAHANYKKNKPLLSWRVHLLPFLGQKALYDKFHLEEPWDSPHNKQLIKQMPDVYKNGAIDHSKFKTNYLVAFGKGTIFRGEDPLIIQDITDGTSNTIMVVEADEDQAVIWTKPADLKYDEKRPRRGLGTLRKNGFNVLFADGSVRLIDNKIDLDKLRALFTSAGAEVVNF